MRLVSLLSLLLCAVAFTGHAQTVHATGLVQISGKKGIAKDASNVVVWLTPRNGPAPPMPPRQYRLVQQGKHFEPHLLIVPVGAVVEFPNKDPFFHNVFSVYEGTPFDLGLYESGSSKPVHFNRPGPSFIFCNIHPEMSAVVLALKTPYYATTNARGEYSIDLPPGDYDLAVWYERSRPEELKDLTRRVTVSESSTEIARLKLTESPSLAENHKNKYGQTYEQAPRYPVP
jgi:plastocyanin